MLHTYKAVLKGDTLEWSDDAPVLVDTGQAVVVHVTILDESVLLTQRQASGQQMAAALERLATTGGLATIPDPGVWQRATREERHLPGRDS